jgi:hypothetical protein
MLSSVVNLIGDQHTVQHLDLYQVPFYFMFLVGKYVLISLFIIHGENKRDQE